MPTTLPLHYTGTYLKRTPGVGNLYVGSYASAGGGGTVLDTLVNPPVTGIAAENKSLTWARGKGTPALTSPIHGKSYYSAADVTNLVKKNMDFVMRFYLEASIARDNTGVPIF